MILRPYQQEGVARMTEDPSLRFLLMDDPGLGKTAQVITALRERGVGSVLVITTKSTLYNWQREFGMWWLNKEVEVLHAGLKMEQRDSMIEAWRKSSRVLVVNYDMLRRHRQFRRATPHAVVVDEAHKMKDRDAKVTAAIWRVKAEHRVLMTATPIDGKPFEFWSLLKYLHPKEYRSFWRFANKYCRWRTAYGNGREFQEYAGPICLDELRDELAPFSLRRAKEDVLSELPPVTVEVVSLDMHPDQAKAYRQMKTKNMVLGGGRLTVATQEISKTVRLRQIAVDPGLLGIAAPAPKFDYIANQLEEATRPIVVFSQFKRALQGVWGHLVQSCGMDQDDITWITGDEDAWDRNLAVQAVNDRTTRLCLCTTAGAEGINLVGADRLIFLDLPWSWGQYVQIMGRLDRIGQEYPVLVSILEMRDTLEQEVWYLIQRKEDVTEELLRDLGTMD